MRGHFRHQVRLLNVRWFNSSIDGDMTSRSVRKQIDWARGGGVFKCVYPTVSIAWHVGGRWRGLL